MKFFAAIIRLSFLVLVVIGTVMADNTDQHAPPDAHPNIHEMSAGVPCIKNCLYRYKNEYDFESKTQHDICTWEPYKVLTFLETRISDCIELGCTRETIKEFQPSEF